MAKQVISPFGGNSLLSAEGGGIQLDGSMAAAGMVPVTTGDQRNPFVFQTISSGGGDGTVTMVSVLKGNGFQGDTENQTTTPEITIGTSVVGIMKGMDGGAVVATPGVDYVVPGTEQYLVVQENYASGSVGAVLVTGSFNTRLLNDIIVNTIAGASLSGNEIILPAGTYEVTAYAITAAGGNQAHIYDFTNGVFLVDGLSVYDAHAGTGADVGNVISIADGYFTLAAQASVGINDWVGLGTSGGLPLTSGKLEVYCQMKIKKLA